MIPKHKSEQGQAIVMVVLAIFALFALVALAMDGGQAFSDRRRAQNAVDAAAYAASLSYLKLPLAGRDLSTEPSNKAREMLASNDYTADNTTQIQVEKFLLPANSVDPRKCQVGSGALFTVTLTTNVNTWFAGFVGLSQLHNTVVSSARACTTNNNEQQSSRNSVVSCNRGTCNGASSTNIMKNGSSLLNLFGGGVFNNSTDPNCLNINNGNTTINRNSPPDDACATISSVSASGSVNHIIYNDGCPSDSTELYNQVPRDCPADLAITCPADHPDPETEDDGFKWAYPGTYGNFPPSGVEKLKPGLYCVTGSFQLTGQETLTGDGITILMQSDGINWTTNDPVNLKAVPSSLYPTCNQGGACPPDGAIPGLLIYAPIANDENMRMTGGGYTQLQGTILASSSHCIYAGNKELGSDDEPQKVQFICDTWELTGTDEISIEYDADYLYNPPVLDSIGLVK